MDSGWSWVVCFVAFVSHLLTVGFSYAIGVYYVEFLEVFNESKGTTAWISALNYGVLCCGGESTDASFLGDLRWVARFGLK